MQLSQSFVFVTNFLVDGFLYQGGRKADAIAIIKKIIQPLVSRFVFLIEHIFYHIVHVAEIAGFRTQNICSARAGSAYQITAGAVVHNNSVYIFDIHFFRHFEHCQNIREFHIGCDVGVQALHYIVDFDRIRQSGK